MCDPDVFFRYFWEIDYQTDTIRDTDQSTIK